MRGAKTNNKLGNRASMPKLRLSAHALVRKADGTPRIDGDPNDLPLQTKLLLTPQERRDLKVELK